MSTTATKRMLAAYIQKAPPTGFLSGKFLSPPANFHDTESIELDIVRSEEDVSIAIIDPATGYNMNSADIYTNKQLTPPVHKEAITVNAGTLLQRVPGSDPFADDTFQSRLNTRVLLAVPKPERKIRRAIELQASQVLQTGIVDLKDAAGITKFTVDYKPKATHFFTVGTLWSAAGADPIADMEILCDLIREDGLAEADEVIFGATSWAEFIRNSTVQALLDNRRMELGGVAPESRGAGAKFMGFVEVGPCRLAMWTYNGRYKDPQTGNSTRYVGAEKVIVRATSGRMDATFGGIPRIVPPDSRVLPFLPPRISNFGAGVDMFVNGWVDAPGENLIVGVGARPLMIPTAIDTFGCMNT